LVGGESFGRWPSASERGYTGQSLWRFPVPTHRLIILGLLTAFLLVVVVDYYRKKK
jgi:hypothetical protein